MLSVIGLFISCSCSPQPREPGKAPIDHDRSQLLVSDEVIFSTVLSDFLVSEESKCASNGRSMPQLVIVDSTSGYMNDRVLEIDERYLLRKKLHQEARRNLLERNPTGHRWSLGNYKPASPSLLIRPLNSQEFEQGEFERSFPDSCAYVELVLPGYSADKKAALVRFTYGPDFHGNVAYYFLTLSQGRWAVEWKRFGHTS